MQVSGETILELKKILLEEFNYDVSRKEADEIATSLIAFTETLIEINNESLCQVAITE
jgi:hypothetical protein